MNEVNMAKVPVFSGKKSDFPMWWSKFKAVAAQRKFAKAITETGEELPTSSKDKIDESTVKGKATIKKIERNDLAMAAFTMAFQTQKLMNMLNKAKTPEWENGKAHEVTKLLLKRYKQDDAINKAEMTKELINVKLAESDDPSELFEEMYRIKNMYETKTNVVADSVLIPFVLSAAPAKYHAIITSEMRDKEENLTLDDLEDAMNDQWRLTPEGKKGGHEEDDKEGEVALSAFSGTCFKCGKSGHKAFQCRSDGDRGRKFNGNCNHCGKYGHKKADCWLLEKNKKNRQKGTMDQNEKGAGAIDTNNEGNEFLLASSEISTAGLTMSQKSFILKDPNIWIGDTGATSDSTFNDMGMQNCKETKSSVTMGKGKSVHPKKVGDIAVTVHNKNGNEMFNAKMTDVAYIPEANFNLFSITRRLRQGFQLGGDKNCIWLEKSGIKIVFDIVIPTPKGAIYCAYLKRKNVEVASASKTNKLISVNLAHQIFGHGDEASTRKTAKALGFDLKQGTMKPCVSCSVAKAKQKNLPSHGEHVLSAESNGRVFLDLSTVKPPSHLNVRVTKPHWRIIVDERTQLKVSDFFETKNGMVEPTCELFYKWKEKGMPVKIVRMDGAGENIKLKKRTDSADWKLSIDYEITARNTPQQNHLAEIAFTIIGNRGRALMHQANVPEEIRYKLYREAFTTATHLDGLKVTTIDGEDKTRYEHWCGKLPRFAKHLRTWGEAGTVKTITKKVSKVLDRGIQCMFVGYAVNHDGDVYRMWNQETDRVMISRDVIWLKRMYFENLRQEVVEVGPSIEEGATMDTEDGTADGAADGAADGTKVGTDEGTKEGTKDGTADGAEEGITFDTGDETDEEAVPTETDGKQMRRGRTTRSGRATYRPARLTDEMNCAELTFAEKNYYSILEDEEIACVGAGVGGGFSNTSELKVMKYKEAMKTEERDRWAKAVEEEHQRMEKYKVWKQVRREEVPNDATIITSTWAMKKKSNGAYRARLNGRGYEQIDGEHYDGTSIASPVTNDATIRITMVLMLLATWSAQIVDVKGAFLHGNLDDGEKIYMEIPEGFESKYSANCVLLLLRTLYGLKQAAMAFWKQLLAAMRRMNFERSRADPCLYYCWTNLGLVLWLSWIDDCLCMGPAEVVEEKKKELMKQFDCSDEGGLDEYVGCKIVKNSKEKWLKFTQPVLLQSFDDEYETNDLMEFETPMETGKVLVKAEPEERLGKSMQKYYRSGVGKLLYLMRWSRPEIMNSVRELSRQMTNPVGNHVKAMHRVMKYCLDYPERGWMLKPSGVWNGDKDFEFVIRGRSDSNYATCPVTRRSVSGYVTYLMDALVTAKSVMQKVVALSVTEAELMSAVQCAQDMLYVMRVLESIGLTVKKPMVLEMDNTGAVDLANNWSVGGRTRHIETRQHFLRDLKEEGIIKVTWIPGKENEADLLTKNLAGPDFNKHTQTILTEL